MSDFEKAALDEAKRLDILTMPTTVIDSTVIDASNKGDKDSEKNVKIVKRGNQKSNHQFNETQRYNEKLISDDEAADNDKPEGEESRKPSKTVPVVEKPAAQLNTNT